MQLKNIKIEGHSIAGEETNIRFPKFGFMFDIGKCTAETVNIPILFLTHGHIDHIGSIAHYLFRRTLKKLPPPDIFAPPCLIKPLKKILKTFADIHNSNYPANYHSVYPDKKIRISDDFFVQAVLADHSITCNCYSIFKSKDTPIPFLSYTGDTTINILDANPFLYQSEILIIECTFIRDSKNLSKAEIYHHIHLDQIFERADKFENKYIILTHQSPRFSRAKLIKELKNKLPLKLKNKVFIL